MRSHRIVLHRSAFLVIAGLFSLVTQGTAFAQASGALSTFFNPSIVSTGMGWTGVANFWSDPNDWSNPALLGYQRGLRYSYGRTQLVPDLADDVFFTSHRFAIGAYGVGLSIAGKPVEGVGGVRLDYGESEATDEEGNVIGTFRSFEEIRQFGIGVNLLETLENLIEATGSEASGLSRHIDVSLGHSWKNILIDLAPASVTLDGRAGWGETTEKDWGALVRVTPVGARASSPVSIDLSAGYSRRNYDDSRIVYIDEDQSDPVVEERLVGGAARIGFRLPVRSSVIWDVLTPFIGVGATWEEARFYDEGVRAGGTIRRTGQEVTLLGLVSGRHGFVDDDAGTINNDTWGVSAGLQYRGVVGVRYDWASYPQSRFLDQEIERRGVTAFFDPFRLWRLKHGEEESIANR